MDALKEVAYTLSPTQQAAYEFCKHLGLGHKDWVKLNKLMARAMDEELDLIDKQNATKELAANRVRRFALTVIGECASAQQAKK